MRAEDVHRAGGHPVEKGRLVEETDAVDVGGDIVVALHHLAGDLDVDGIDVVEQAGGEEAADLEDEPGEDKDCEGAWVPAAGGGLVVSCQLSVLSSGRSVFSLRIFRFSSFDWERITGN